VQQIPAFVQDKRHPCALKFDEGTGGNCRQRAKIGQHLAGLMSSRVVFEPGTCKLERAKNLPENINYSIFSHHSLLIATDRKRNYVGGS
jgi:hypothetical protein